ncbi:PEP-CTERM sorting domain-containing protein [Massilia sp. METH4]|uniref:PEP-CTERM sorting domain-containing protein n=1 Tax=Massilia sp. METH4 TaxID=3123041 RepID=UPI0030D34A90
MHIRVIAAALLATAASSAQAYEKKYVFEYEGAWYNHTLMGDEWVWDASRAWRGYFIGDDVDGDGTIVASEVSKFVANGFQADRCAVQEYTSCGATFEKYTIAGVFYSAWHVYNVPGQYTRSQYWNLPDGGIIYNDYPIDEHYALGADTQFTVSVVPEPATWLMLGTGLLAAGAAARRARRG